MKIFTKKQHKKDVREMNGEEIMKPIWELLYLDRWGKGKDNDELIKVTLISFDVTTISLIVHNINCLSRKHNGKVIPPFTIKCENNAIPPFF